MKKRFWVGRLFWALGAWLFVLRASALQISLSSGTNFWTDFASSPTLQAEHVAVSIVNADGVTYSNLWVSLGGFTNSSVRLGSGEPGYYPLGGLSDTQSGAAFFYLQAANNPGNKSYNNQFSVGVYSGHPSVGMLLASTNFPLLIQGTIAASANKITAVTFTPTNNPVVGGRLKISVFGDVGGVGNGALMNFTGASWTNWNAGAFQLVSSLITVTNASNPAYNQTLTNTLMAVANSHFTGNGNLYEADYYFRVVATTGTNPTPVSPISYIQSGNQMKHTSLSAGTLPPVLPATNLTTLNSLVSYTQLYTNQIVTFTFVVSNLSSAYEVSLDRFVDTLPAGFDYVANSSTFGGEPILDPTNVNQVLTWSQGSTYNVAPASSATFSFRAAVPGVAVPTYFTNACVAYVENFLIGTTLVNPAPATATVRALTVPIAGSVTNAAWEGQTLMVAAPGVLANAVEPNGFSATVVTNSAPAHGSVTVNADGSFTYVPTPFFWGWDSFTFVLTNSNLGVSTGTNYINVQWVNQPPAFIPGANQLVEEGAGPQTVAGWATGMSAGTNDPAQTLTFHVFNSNSDLFSVQPALSSSGTLTYTPAPFAYGSATVTVYLTDGGGTANGGVETVTNTFNISVQGLTNYWYGGSNLTVNLADALAPGGVSQTNYRGVLSVPATASNPFIIKLGGAGAHFNNSSNYTWTIATTTRGVLGWTTNPILVDSSAFTNDLAGGYFSVGLAPDGASVDLVFTGNRPPTASPLVLNRAIGTSLKIPIGLVLTNYTADPDGDRRVFLGVGSSTNGAYIATNGAYILFAPANNLSESFSYSVSDNRPYRPGDTVYVASNWITVNVTNAVGYAQGISSSSGGSVSVRFAGVPGYAYDIQRAPNPSGPWSTVATTNAPPKGVWLFIDANPPQPSAFYRTAQH